VLLTPKKWHPETIRRYCEIIAIALKANKQMWDYVPGSDATAAAPFHFDCRERAPKTKQAMRPNRRQISFCG
jgi:hypothetical protein